MIDPLMAVIPRLGEANQPSPLATDDHGFAQPERFVSDQLRIPLFIATPGGTGQKAGQIHFEMAGPRENLYFDPAKTKAAIVTCGGLCPGLNDVVRSLFHQLYYGYGVQEVLGIRYGYHGLNAAHGHPPLHLTPALVSDIHKSGGTILGTSRGPEEPAVMVDFLRSQGVQILFTIGGDGTQRGAHALYLEAFRQGYPLAVVGVPKTIDNDILYVARTFGFLTAIDEARGVIDSAHTEARAVLNGIGLVRLMGRHSGFIAAGATIASGEVNFCLVPEVPFALDGPKGLLAALESRLQRKRHAVIVVAEGAGQDLIPRDRVERDASGNVRLADIGFFLRARIEEHFRARNTPVNIRYIDPSYIIRSKPVTSDDAILCDRLARNAVHAAMAGKSSVVIGYLHDTFVHVPIEMVAKGRQKVDPDGGVWRAVLGVTGQSSRYI